MNIRNQVQLVGRLGANPEMKVLKNGNKVVRFSLAVTASYTNGCGKRVKEVQWHPVIVWNNLAGIAEKILSKGVQVIVDGKVEKRTYINKDGEKRSIAEVVANELFVTTQKAA